MTWRHDATTWTKLEIIQISELSAMKTMETKRINVLAHLQAEIGKLGFVTSWHDVMMSRDHKNEKSITDLNSVTWKTIETKE